MDAPLSMWVSFLQFTNKGFAIPLIICGVALMILGFKFWRLSVVATFSIVTAWIIGCVTSKGDQQVTIMIAGGVLAGLISFWPAKHLVGVLGGVLIGGIIMMSLENLGLRGMTLWCCGAAVAAIGSAYSYLNRQHVVILITAFLGACLLLSGLTLIVMAMPKLWGSLQAMSSNSVIVLPFMLIVPTVMSAFYQISELRRSNMSF